MRLTIGTTSDLRARLLTYTQASTPDTTFDDALNGIGAGTAVLFEKWCDRKFYRSTSATYQCRANLQTIWLPRYPVESITSFEIKEDETAGFVAETDVDYRIELELGLINMGVTLGGEDETLRITYQGGYWFANDIDGGLEDDLNQPSGSTLMPDDLKEAWLLQCEAIWASRNNVGMGTVSDGKTKPVLLEMDLLPMVKSVLQAHRRYVII